MFVEHLPGSSSPSLRRPAEGEAPDRRRQTGRLAGSRTAGHRRASRHPAPPCPFPRSRRLCTRKRSAELAHQHQHQHQHQHEAVATTDVSESPTLAEDRPRDGRTARAAGSSRWGSCERARAGGWWVSGAAARVAVRAELAVVRMRWMEACPARGRRGTWTAVLGAGWVVLAEEALVPRGASADGPHAGAVYPATCTGGRSAPPLNPPALAGVPSTPRPLLQRWFSLRSGVYATASSGRSVRRWSVAERAARLLCRKASRERGAAGSARRRPRPR